MSSLPLFWQVVVALLGGGLATALIQGLQAILESEERHARAEKAKAEAEKLKAEGIDIVADTAWETVERLAKRVQALEEKDKQRAHQYEQLWCEHVELRHKYDALLIKSQSQEKRIRELERQLNQSREREETLCALLGEHGIDPNGEVERG